MQNHVEYIVVDFDGTILNENHEISQQLINKFIELQNKGYKIILCSGRSFHGIKKVAEQINLAKYQGIIVAYNGGEIYEYEQTTWKIKHANNFALKQTTEIFSLLDTYVQSMVSYDEQYLSTNKPIPLLNKSAKLMGLKLNQDYQKETPKIVLFDKPEHIQKIKNEVKEIVAQYKDLNVFSSLPHLIEITPPRSLKGEALKQIAKKYQKKPQNFICFGDGENDLSMFEFCYYSVAMANAVYDLKEIASHQTLSNQEDGVYQFLHNNF